MSNGRTNWVIERYYGDALYYWNGRAPPDTLPWTTAYSDAIHFATKADADAMLTWHCQGQGRTVEHGYLSSDRQTEG